MPSPWTVSFEPILLTTAAVLVIGVAVVRRNGRGPASPWRAVSLAGAAVLLAACWASPLQTLASHYLLTAHLAQITLLMGVVPPLLLLSLPRETTLRLPRALRTPARVLVHPVSGILAVNAAFFGWHASAPYDLSLRTPWVYGVQQVTLLLASLVFWWPIVVPLGGRRVVDRWATLGYILVATIPQTFAGITVALVKHPLYQVYASAPRTWALSALTDQQIAGACTALVSKIALFTAFSVVFMRMLGEAPEDDGDDGGGGGGGRRPITEKPSPRPSGSVPWLTELNRGRTVSEPPPRRVRVPAGPASRRG